MYMYIHQTQNEFTDFHDTKVHLMIKLFVIVTVGNIDAVTFKYALFQSQSSLHQSVSL